MRDNLLHEKTDTGTDTDTDTHTRHTQTQLDKFKSSSVAKRKSRKTKSRKNQNTFIFFNFSFSSLIFCFFCAKFKNSKNFGPFPDLQNLNSGKNSVLSKGPSRPRPFPVSSPYDGLLVRVDPRARQQALLSYL